MVSRRQVHYTEFVHSIILLPYVILVLYLITAKVTGIC